MSRKNLILATDSYKASHFLQYPPGTHRVSSYVEARPTKGGKYETIIPFGLQILLMKYLQHPITVEDIQEAREFWPAHGLPFNEEGWKHIYRVHGGYLPLHIKAVPEGMPVPLGSPLVVVENTDDAVPWLVSYVETMVLRAVWYGSTVATKSWHLKKLIKEYLDKTGDPSLLPFKLHDFGARGVSSAESAGIGGCAHLAAGWMGTDTVEGILVARDYYGAKEMPAFSIPAAEHSTVTAWGELSEAMAYSNMIEKFGGEGKIYAVVSDSYDIINAVSNIWGEGLREDVIKRGGTLVVRPDSGHPATVVTACLRILESKFGSTVNAKGYKVLNNVRVIQGDGINPSSIKEILDWITSAGFSADNVAFGMGGQLLQGVDRDTLSFAMKASAININGQWKDIFKNPKTDPEKKSKSGRQTLLDNGGGRLIPGTISPEGYVYTDGHTKDVMQTVFREGEVVNLTTLAEIRGRTAL